MKNTIKTLLLLVLITFCATSQSHAGFSSSEQKMPGINTSNSIPAGYVDLGLPSEAEWEYAARGGRKSQGYKYLGSNTLGNVAWYDDNSGNVWEWCQDWFDSYSGSSQTNPNGPSTGSFRVLRGGSWSSDARYCRVSFRSYDLPDYREFNLGFRLAL